MKRVHRALLGVGGAAAIVVFGQVFAVQAGPLQVAQAEPDPELLAALMEEGEEVYGDQCAGCHGNDGEGAVGPELAGNDFMQFSSSVIGQILAGDPEHGGMPAFASQLNNRQVSAVGTYIRNAWGNEYGIVSERAVATLRGGGGDSP